MRSWLAIALMLGVQAAAPRGSLEPGTLPQSWTTGGSCPEQPPVRSHEYNSDFVILRQSGCTNFEKPFLYLIFGERAALLIDTGAQTADVGSAVQQVIARWAARHGTASPPLVVVHSHGHGDHIAGDAQFKDRPNTTFVAADVQALTAFFGFKSWPDGGAATYDLGGRLLDIIPIPGHQAASIAIYDRRTGILMTGDTLYPGRLYVRDGPAFIASIRRLVAFTRDKPISHVLGAHIENARAPFVDYPEGTKYQPDEHALELGRAHLLELDASLTEMNGHIARRVLRDFTIWPVDPPR